MTLPQPNLLARAKQGNVKAIATLIHRSLEPQGIQVKAAQKERCLYILLEASHALSQQALVHFIQQGIEKLALQTIDCVRIYGKQTGAIEPDWSEDIQLQPIRQYMPQPVPSIEAMPMIDFPEQHSVHALGNGATANGAVGSTVQSVKAKPKVTIQVNSFLKSQPSPNGTEAKSRNTPTLDSQIVCPRSHFALSLLVTLLAFPPLGIAALIFGKQVKGKYQQQNYEGAKSASETAKILCVVGICLASPFYLLLGFAVMSWVLIAPSLQQQLNIAQQAEAKSAIVSINRGQQTFFLSQSRFAKSLEELELNPQVTDYKYQIITVDATNAIVTATAQKQGLKSYAGIVYFERGQSGFIANTRAAVCETQAPSLVSPAVIQVKSNQVQCPPDSALVF